MKGILSSVLLFRYIINTYVNNMYNIITYDLIEEFDFLLEKFWAYHLVLFIQYKKMCHLKDMFLFFQLCAGFYLWVDIRHFPNEFKCPYHRMPNSFNLHSRYTKRGIVFLISNFPYSHSSLSAIFTQARKWLYFISNLMFWSRVTN